MLAQTISLWRQLVGRTSRSLQADLLEAPTDERRIWIRYPSTVETTCGPVSGNGTKGLPARVRNISRGGVNLLVEHCVSPGSLLGIELPGPAEPETYTVLAYVLHATPEATEQWSLGCTFARELNDEDLEAFGAHRRRSPASDQRQWMRYCCSATAQYQLVSAKTIEKWPAKVLDISASGIRLSVDQLIDVGALLSLELHAADGTASRVMLACVARLNPTTAGEWILGCNFIRELSDDELQALV
jgi:PilZ domain